MMGGPNLLEQVIERYNVVQEHGMIESSSGVTFIRVTFICLVRMCVIY